MDLRCQSTLQTNNSKQFGIEALYRWRAGPGEEAICPRSRAESEAQLETLLMNAGSWSQSSSPPACLPPTHAPKQNPKAGRQQRGREVTCPPKPRVSTLTICCTDRKLGVRVSYLCRLPLLKPRESVANESLQCSLHIGAGSASHLKPLVYLSDSCKASASQEGLVLCPPGGSRLSVRVQDSEEERRESMTGWDRGG